jgi:hypothetical protein
LLSVVELLLPLVPDCVAGSFDGDADDGLELSDAGLLEVFESLPAGELTLPLLPGLAVELELSVPCEGIGIEPPASVELALFESLLCASAPVAARVLAARKVAAILRMFIAFLLWARTVGTAGSSVYRR